MTLPETTIEHALEITHIEHALKYAEEPQTLSWILKQLPKSLQANTEVLEKLLISKAPQQQIFAFPGQKATRYWHSSPQEWVKNRLLYKFQAGLRTKSTVISEVFGLATIKGAVSKKMVEDIFKELVTQGKIHSHPAYLGARTKLFSLAPLDPQDYVHDAMEKLAKKLNIPLSQLKYDSPENTPEPVKAQESAKFPVVTNTELVMTNTEEHFVTATEPKKVSGTVEPLLEDILLEAMLEVNPQVATGDVVAISELRKFLDIKIPEKAEFDRGMLNLAENWKINLHKFDHAGTSSPQELEAYVRDEEGEYFNFASLRRAS